MTQTTFQSFVDEVLESNGRVREVIENFTELQQTGMIGDCYLRRVAERYIKAISNQHGYLNVVVVMKDIVFGVCLEITKQKVLDKH